MPHRSRPAPKWKFFLAASHGSGRLYSRNSWRNEVSAASPADNVRLISGEDARRSTRIDRIIPLIVMGRTKMGQLFQERTCSVSINLHGCRYASRHDYPVGTWIDLQVLDQDGQVKMPAMRAQVRSLHTPESTRELNQVGVELQIPSNIWGISTPPEDWQRSRRTNISSTQMATGAAPARQSSMTSVTLPPAVGQIGLQTRAAPVAEFPGPTSSAAKIEPVKAAAPEKRERMVITPEQLLAGLKGRIQQEADKAVQAALGTHVDAAVRLALSKLEVATKAHTNESEAYLSQRLETLVQSSQEEVYGRLEVRLEANSGRAEELAERLEKMATEIRTELAETKKLSDKMTLEIAPKVHAGLEVTISRLTEDFEAAAARVCDRQIVRMMENKQMVTREVASHLEARTAEARSLAMTAAGSTLAEFRRQLDVNMELALSEAMQKIMSSLASLDAENRAACEQRRRSLVGEVAKAAEQSADQFRKGMKAFLYSCLVAAVGAVDEHAQSTRAGLVNDPGKIMQEIDAQVESPGNDTSNIWNDSDPHSD